VQYLSVFPVLFYVFGGVAYLILCGIESALLASVVVMFSSHNIVASLCYYSVDLFILEIIIMKYDCKPTLDIVVKKLSMVGVCKP